MGDFYGPGNEIGAGFGTIGSTEKERSGSIMSNFWGWFFHAARDKKDIKFKLEKNISIEKKKKISYFLRAKKHFQLCLAPIETPHRGTYL